MSHEPSQESTHSPEQPVEAPSGVGVAEGAREAIRVAVTKVLTEPAPNYAITLQDRLAAGIVEAVAPLVGAEVAAAVSEAQAEVERLTTLLDSRNRVVEKVKRLAQNWQARALSAEAEFERLREGIRALPEDLSNDDDVMDGRVADWLEDRARALLSPSPAAITGEADVVRTLQQFADHDLHGVIPHSEIANEWYHRGLDAAQQEASEWAERIGMDAPAPVSSGEACRHMVTTYTDGETPYQCNRPATHELFDTRGTWAPVCDAHGRGRGVPEDRLRALSSGEAATGEVWERHVSTRCPRMREHGGIGVVDGKVIHLNPHPCPDCYSIESFWHRIPWEPDGRTPAPAPVVTPSESGDAP